MTVSSIDFSPQWSQISAVSNAFQAVVTFTAAHDFTLGQVVSFLIDNEFGMRELNGKYANVVDTTSDTITITLNTTGYTPFSIPASPKSIPQCIPVGSTNSKGDLTDPIGPLGAFKQVTQG